MFKTSIPAKDAMNKKHQPLLVIVGALITATIASLTRLIEFEKLRIILEYAFTSALLYFAYLQSNYTSLQYEILEKTTRPIIYIRSNDYNQITIENASNFPLFNIIPYGSEYQTNENEHFFDIIDVIYPYSKTVLETPIVWRKKMVADLTITYCLSAQKGERESIREMIALDAPENIENPVQEIETIREIIPSLYETSKIIQDIYQKAVEENR